MFNNIALLIAFFFLGSISRTYGQHRVYELSFKKEAKVIGLGAALNTVGYILLNRADRATIGDINQLDPDKLFGLDRRAIDNYSQRAETFSDVLLFSAASFPFVAYSLRKCRQEDWSILLMGVETFLLTNGVTNITKSLAKRYRPYNYNPNVDMEIKLSNGSRLSFFSGHASQTAAMCFFFAQVVTDLYPDMDLKYLVWTAAAATPLTIGYLRFLAGKHFPTDILTGYAVGATIGYLIPKMHLHKGIDIGPTGHGLSLRVQL